MGSVTPVKHDLSGERPPTSLPASWPLRAISVETIPKTECLPALACICFHARKGYRVRPQGRLQDAGRNGYTGRPGPIKACVRTTAVPGLR